MVFPTSFKGDGPQKHSQIFGGNIDSESGPVGMDTREEIDNETAAIFTNALITSSFFLFTRTHRSSNGSCFSRSLGHYETSMNHTRIDRDPNSAETRRRPTKPDQAPRPIPLQRTPYCDMGYAHKHEHAHEQAHWNQLAEQKDQIFSIHARRPNAWEA